MHMVKIALKLQEQKAVLVLEKQNAISSSHEMTSFAYSRRPCCSSSLVKHPDLFLEGNFLFHSQTTGQSRGTFKSARSPIVYQVPEFENQRGYPLFSAQYPHPQTQLYILRFILQSSELNFKFVAKEPTIRHFSFHQVCIDLLLSAEFE